jgi:meiosis-specific protein HOP1
MFECPLTPILLGQRYATFKLYYTRETPDDYEPPFFASVDPEKSRPLFSTHDAEEVPEKVTCGELNSGYHSSVIVRVLSLPSC